jgi:hypothetical protein
VGKDTARRDIGANAPAVQKRSSQPAYKEDPAGANETEYMDAVAALAATEKVRSAARYAERRVGELLREMAERGERQKAGDASGGNGSTRKPLDTPKLADLGITKTQSSRWQRLAKMDGFRAGVRAPLHPLHLL